MAGKLPPDFNADWYAAAYPDVALSGLGPHEHYRQFGRLLGRPPKAAPGAGGGKAKSETRGGPAPRGVTPGMGGSTPSPSKAAARPPIIDRPDGFDASDAVPALGGSSDPDAVFTLDSLAAAASAPALAAYARLLRVEMSGDLDAQAGVTCGAAAFQGAVRLENAWVAEPSVLRLMLSGSPEEPSASHRPLLRAYQADPASPADLRMLGPGIELPPRGPVFNDLELVHPLMPLLLELARPEAGLSAIALMPFPSLLPGGLHAAELKALQDAANPMDAFWSLSDVLLREAIGQPGWADRSVTSVTVNPESAAGDEPLPGQAVQQWLAAVFELSANDSRRRGGLRLALPGDCVPTISALVSRRLDAGDKACVSGPYLIAEAGSNQPRWSVVLPAEVEPATAIPMLRPASAKASISTASRTAPVHLAIALRPTVTPREAAANDSPRAAEQAPLSVVLSAADGARAEALIQSVRGATGDIEFFVDSPHPSDELRAALDRACEGLGWTQLQPGADLREVARGARHPTLLTISDRIVLGEQTLPTLLNLLQRDASAGSASCALLAEKVIKKKIVLQPATGGMFPTGVSFASAPRLSFGELDALQALPDLAYPVVANTLSLTLWRTAALAELPSASGPVAASGQDIRLGLDLIEAGYRNWCTTQVTARLAGPYVPRDLIDPVGAAYLQPQRWEELLSRVTVIRELF